MAGWHLAPFQQTQWDESGVDALPPLHLEGLAPLTNELLAADDEEKDCDTGWGRVEWMARDGNRGLGEEYTCNIVIEIRVFVEKSYMETSACHYSAPTWEYMTAGVPVLQGAYWDLMHVQIMQSVFTLQCHCPPFASTEDQMSWTVAEQFLDTDHFILIVYNR